MIDLLDAYTALPRADAKLDIICAPDVLESIPSSEKKSWGGTSIRVNNYFQPGQWAIYQDGKIVAASFMPMKSAENQPC